MKLSTCAWPAVLGSLLLAACAGPTRPDDETPPAAPQAANHSYPATADASAAANKEDAEAARLEALAPQARPAAGPEQYPDVFDRIRAGFKLDDVDSREIDGSSPSTPTTRSTSNACSAAPEPLPAPHRPGNRGARHAARARAAARGRKRLRALRALVGPRERPLAVHARHRRALRPQAGLVVRRPPRRASRRRAPRSTTCSTCTMNSSTTGCSPSPPTTAANSACSAKSNANRGAGKPVDFFSLNLPVETRAYVPKLMAMRRLVANPEDYGIAFSPIANEPYFARVDTGGQLDLTLAAELAGITLDEVYELNPAFHRWATDPAGPALPAAAASKPPRLSRPQPRPAEPRRTRARLAAQGPNRRVGRDDRQEYKTTAVVVRDMNNLKQRQRWSSAASCACRRRFVNLPAKVMLAGGARRRRGGRSGAPRGARGAQRRFAVAHRQAPSHGASRRSRLNGMATWRHAARRPEARAEHVRAVVGASRYGDPAARAA